MPSDLAVLRTVSLAWQWPVGPQLLFADMTVNAGQTVLLQGPSGSGKSTCLSLVSGLRAVQSGEIWVCGQALHGQGAAERDALRARHMALLPQGLHLSPSLSVHDNLALVYFAQGLKVERERIAECLGTLGVAELADRLPHTLSGGQAQRVALARALLLKPRLILADEPTAHLDDASAEAVLQNLQQVQQHTQAALLVATHDVRVRTAWPQARHWQMPAPQTAAAGEGLA
jgi:putative ABC transport system ATP-binding protein